MVYLQYFSFGKKKKVVSPYRIRWTSRSSNYFYQVEKQNIYRNELHQ